MFSIIDNSHLRNLVLGTWRKVKEQINNISQRISSLEDNTAKLNSQNTFTSRNVFMENSPIVNKYFSIKNIFENNATDVPYDKSTYCCNPKQGIGAGNHISAILVPIHDSRPGDMIEALYFTVNANNQRIVGDVPNLSTYTVQDIQYRGHYCIIFEVNKTFGHPVGFGFSVRDTFYGGRRIRLLKQNANSNAWTSYNKPVNGEVLNHNDTFLIPYTIARRSSSEVLTRYDIENNTVPINNHNLGELKMLAYDAGEQFELGGNTWLRCDGQSLPIQYNEFYKNMRNVPAFMLPNKPDYGYLYICVG